MIRFLNGKVCLLAEIKREIVEVYDEGAMNEGDVRKWCRLFKVGRNNVHDEEGSGPPSLVTDDLKEKVTAKICENRRFTIFELRELFLAGRSLTSDRETKDVVQD